MIRRDFIDILGEFEGDYVTRQHIVAHGAEKGIRHCIWCGRGTCVWYNNWFVAQYIIYHKHWPLITCCIYVEELHISDMNNIVWWSLYIAWRRSVISCCRRAKYILIVEVVEIRRWWLELSKDVMKACCKSIYLRGGGCGGVWYGGGHTHLI